MKRQAFRGAAAARECVVTNTEAAPGVSVMSSPLQSMYIRHFGLDEPPFSIAPNPRYLYLSPSHREALAHLLYGIGVGGGFVVLSGEVGMGKTTLCRALLEQLPEDVEIALVFNPRLNSRELLATICDELRIAYGGGRASLKQLIDVLNAHLLEAHARGRRVIVLIDEAQNLRFDVLEQVRLLTNLETDQAKLLQIILVGQPELNQILERPNLRQLAQRITARYHLDPLDPPATEEYIRHRLNVAGGRDDLFRASAVREIHRRSGGIPRLINLLGDRALLGAYTLGLTRVDVRTVRRAAEELRGAGVDRSAPRVGRTRFLWGVLLGGLLMSVILSGVIPDLSLTGLRTLWQSAEFWPTLDSDLISRSSEPASRASPQSAEGRPEAMSREEGLRALFTLWGEGPADSEPCRSDGSSRLRCQHYRGSFERLLRLNLPAVLDLQGQNSAEGAWVLIQIRGNEALLRGRSGDRWLPLSTVESLWMGRAVLVFQPPVQDRRSLRLGAVSPLVPWIRAQLGDAPSSTMASEVQYDGALRQRVRDFQAALGLRPDGLVGALTLIALQGNGVQPAVPRLRAEP